LLPRRRIYHCAGRRSDAFDLPWQSAGVCQLCFLSWVSRMPSILYLQSTKSWKERIDRLESFVNRHPGISINHLANSLVAEDADVVILL
jgi:hypothetical protein